MNKRGRSNSPEISENKVNSSNSTNPFVFGNQNNQQEERRVFVRSNNKRVVTKKLGLNFVDDSTPSYPIFDFNEEDRKNVINNQPNPFGYPQEYFDIYSEEITLRQPEGYTNCINITNQKIFIPGQEQQFSKQIKISQNTNINCVKSRGREMDISGLELSDKISDLLLEKYGLVKKLSLNQFKYEEIAGKSRDQLIAEQLIQNDPLLNELKNEYNMILLNPKFIEYTQSLGLHTRIYLGATIPKRGMYLSSDPETNDIVNDFRKNSKKFTSRISELNDQEALILDQQYQQYIASLNNNLSIFEYIIIALKLMFGEYSQFIFVAGGFALSYYTHKNYGYATEFGDLDLFIAGCNEDIANQIVQIFQTSFETFLNRVYEVDHVIFSTSGFLSNFEHPISISIIKRLYVSPAEIILGFDIDASCILVNMEGEIWATKRGFYAIQNGYNVVNFERLSPSYEYRLIKFNKRGFGIWIPQIEYFKRNVLFDANVLGRKGSDIIIRFFIQGKIQGEMKGLAHSDYHHREGGDEISYPVSFQTVNPNSQITSTFHQTVLDDPINWYPHNEKLKSIYTLDIPDPEGIEIITNINSPPIDQNIIYADNIIRRKKTSKPNFQRGLKVCRTLLSYISSIIPNAHVFGEAVYRALTGRSKNFRDNTLYIWDPSIDTEEKSNELAYYIMRQNIFISMATVFNVDKLEQGEVVFANNNSLEQLYSLTPEQNISNFGKGIIYGREFDDSIGNTNPTYTSQEIVDSEINGENMEMSFTPNIKSKKIKESTFINKPTFAKLAYNHFDVLFPKLTATRSFDQGSAVYINKDVDLSSFWNEYIVQLPDRTDRQKANKERANDPNYSIQFSGINLVIIDPTIDLKRVFDYLETYEDIPSVFYYQENIYSRREYYQKIRSGDSDSEVLTYPAYENYFSIPL